MFGNRLNFNNEVQCVDAPYFDAPGTMEAPLGYKAAKSSGQQGRAPALGALESTAPLLPPVTIVFCSVDGAARAALRAGAPAAAQTVHCLLRDCVLQTLRAFLGGYLCRDQEGELRFLLAFNTPQVRTAFGYWRQHAACISVELWFLTTWQATSDIE